MIAQTRLRNKAYEDFNKGTLILANCTPMRALPVGVTGTSLEERIDKTVEESGACSKGLCSSKLLVAY